jgi:7-cyano-7-deazaguanine synthase
LAILGYFGRDAPFLDIEPGKGVDARHAFSKAVLNTVPATDAFVLLSGGIDSAATLALTVTEGFATTSLFIDYGQSAASAERCASRSLAVHFDVEWREVRATTGPFGTGEIVGRNAFLVHVAMLVFGRRSGLILLGIHSGTNYRDCSPAFVAVTQKSLDFHSGGVLRLSAPFLNWSKAEVHAYAIAASVPVHLTHSCEAEVIPCGSCPSCRDRELIVSAPA